MSDEAVIETNWHAACSELWEPIELPGLRITPITDRDSAGVPADRQLMIIPGQGFGTGHHTTTRMLLEEIARVAREEPSLQPTRIADIGSGSGILALAAATMFGVPVEGVEIEVPAVENAKENIAINHLEHLVTVKLGESTLLEGQFKLVLANIYGEVLLALRQEMERLVSVGGLLCVSGISELTALQVSSAYTGSKAFCVVNRACSGEWEMLTFRRISVRRD
jgi:ribosomal protein L11 methyltransferase